MCLKPLLAVGLGIGEGQGSLACCSPRGRKESDPTWVSQQQIAVGTTTLPQEKIEFWTRKCFVLTAQEVHHLGLSAVIDFGRSFPFFPPQIPIWKFLQSSPPPTHKSDADCIPSHIPSQVSLSEAHFRYVTSPSPVVSWIWGSEQNGSFLPFCLYLLFWFSVHFLLFASSGLWFHCAKNCSLRSTFYLQEWQTHYSGNPIFNYLLEAFPVSFNPSPPPPHITRCALPCHLTQGIARLPNPYSWNPQHHSLWIHPVALSSSPPYLLVLFIVSSFSFLCSSQGVGSCPAPNSHSLWMITNMYYRRETDLCTHLVSWLLCYHPDYKDAKLYHRCYVIDPGSLNHEIADLGLSPGMPDLTDYVLNYYVVFFIKLRWNEFYRTLSVTHIKINRTHWSKW